MTTGEVNVNAASPGAYLKTRLGQDYRKTVESSHKINESPFPQVVLDGKWTRADLEIVANDLAVLAMQGWSPLVVVANVAQGSDIARIVERSVPANHYRAVPASIAGQTVHIVSGNGVAKTANGHKPHIFYVTRETAPDFLKEVFRPRENQNSNGYSA